MLRYNVSSRKKITYKTISIDKARTQYIRIVLCFTGSPRVDGDEEEDEADDLENEFSFCNANSNVASGSKFDVQSKWNWRGPHSKTGASTSVLSHHNAKTNSSFPRLTYGEVWSLFETSFMHQCYFMS